MQRSASVILLTTFLYALCGIAAGAEVATASPPALDEVVVTGTWQPTEEINVPASVSVLNAATLQDAGQQHIEDVVALVPNLNWAGDTSRPRYFQIRGIGELAQYTGAPNPSVGFLIDDIDFSGLGSAATLFDVDHIEVLRGPQGMRYGANALGGLIYAQSAQPADTFGGRVEVSGGDYGERSYGAVLTGPLPQLDSGFRLAAQRYTSDGYYRNVYLNRDTDQRDELTLRARWSWQPSTALRVELSALRVQMDNGYDAFTLDGSRRTQSDNPGVDAQHSTGASIKLLWAGWHEVSATVLGSYAGSNVKYAYDGDWGNPALWAPYTYSYTDTQLRQRQTHSLEARLASDHAHGLNWLLGVYALQLHEDLFEDSAGVFFDPSVGASAAPAVSLTMSHYQSRTGALFGQLQGELSESWTWSAGLRAERWVAHYGDVIVNPDAAHDFRPAYNLWGGAAALTHRLDPDASVYATVSRGYKAGGFNLSQYLLPNQLQFGPESDLNFELGYKAELYERRIHLSADVFYMRRRALQVITSQQLQPDNPNTFVMYTGNASSGFNYGAEGQLQWQSTTQLALGAALGLLQTRYHGFVQDFQQLPDRALPHAPAWQAALNATWHDARGPFARIDLTGMGSYYFDLPPNYTTSHPYAVLNGRVGWQRPRWSASLWGRNLLNKDYPVRGFYFSDTPRDFLAVPPVNRLYTQLGDPRAWGVDLNYYF